DLLRENVDLTGRRIKGPLHIDLEALFLGPSTMIGEIEAFLDECIDVDRPMLTRTFARVQQHVLDDGVCPFAVLYNLVEIIAQGVREFGDFSARLFVSFHSVQRLAQFVDQFSRDSREIVDKVERVLDFVSDTGGELTKRSKLLCLDKAILRGPQILQ